MKQEVTISDVQNSDSNQLKIKDCTTRLQSFSYSDFIIFEETGFDLWIGGSREGLKLARQQRESTEADVDHT